MALKINFKIQAVRVDLLWKQVFKKEITWFSLFCETLSLVTKVRHGPYIQPVEFQPHTLFISSSIVMLFYFLQISPNWIPPSDFSINSCMHL